MSNIFKLKIMLFFLGFYCFFLLELVFFGGYPLRITAPVLFFFHFFPNLPLQGYIFIFISFLLSLLTLLIPLRLKSYGQAHFANNFEIKKMGLFSSAGLILGIKSQKYIRYNEPLSTLVYAPPGSGKTAGIIIPSLLSCSHSMIVHDPKSELFELTSKRRSAFSKIIKFAPGENESDSWNPFAENLLPKSFPEIQILVERVATALIPQPPKSEPIWTNKARSLFVFWALYLIHINNSTSLSEIAKNIYRGQTAIAEVLDEEENTLPERVKLEGEALIEQSENTFTGFAATLQSSISVFLNEIVAKNTSGESFDLRQIRKERTTIYICIKDADQERLKNLVSMFFEFATLSFLNEIEKDTLPVTFLLDEFVRLGKMPEVLKMPAIGRGYKFNAIYVCQSISQISDIYGEYGTKQLQNTCSYFVIFAQNEFAVAKEISESIGQKTRIKQSKSSSLQRSSFLKTRSENLSEEGILLLRSQDIMSLKQGNILILKQGNFETPIKAKTAFWFKDRQMKRLIETKTREFKEKECPNQYD